MPKHDVTPPPALLDFLKPYGHDVQQLALAVRRLILENIPPMTEIVEDASTAVTVGYTPSGRFKDAVCHFAVYPAHVILGFNRGTELADPERQLRGLGKMVRHVMLEKKEDLNPPFLRLFLHAAARHVHHRGTHHGVIIKSSPGPKSRPNSTARKASAAITAD